MKKTDLSFLNFKTIAVLAIVLVSLSAYAFGPQEENKQIITIEFWEIGLASKNLGLYVYQNGKKIEFTPIEGVQGVIERGETFNNCLSKYYDKGWRLVSANQGQGFGTNAYQRYVLEK